MSQLTFNNVGGQVVKSDERYTVTDNTSLNHLVLSSTRLEPMKSTTGHSHQGQEEVYMFVEGSGKMELDDSTVEFKKGDIILIKDGVFHRVHAGSNGAYFVCVFDGYRYDAHVVLGYN